MYTQKILCYRKYTGKIANNIICFWAQKGDDHMAQRGIMITKEGYPFFEEIQVNLTWFGGFSKQQMRRCYLSLQLNFLADERYLDFKPLEISSTSHIQTGVALSAMNLKKYCRTLNKDIVLESAFQGSRIYFDGNGKKIGPSMEAYSMEGREAKRYVKEKSCGYHSYEYCYDGVRMVTPSFHISLFYDWLYLSALCEESNRRVREELIAGGYNAFTDIATKSLNSQARSAAIFVSLEKMGLLGEVQDFDCYLKLFRVNMNNKNDYAGDGAYENIQRLQSKGTYAPLHPEVVQRVSGEEVKRYYNKYLAG